MGMLLLADIGIPLPLYEQAGIASRQTPWTDPVVEISW